MPFDPTFEKAPRVRLYETLRRYIGRTTALGAVPAVFRFRSVAVPPLSDSIESN